MRALLAALLLAAGGQEGDAVLPPVSLERLDEGVWLHTSYRDVPPWGPVLSNGLVVATDDAVWLVDTAWTDEQTEEVLALAEEAVGRPVTHAVFTHAHDDKMGGVTALRATGVETFAAEASNRLAAGRGLTPAEHALSSSPDGRLTAPGAPRGLEVYYPGPAHTDDNVVVAATGTGVLFGGCMVRPGGARDLGNTADGDVQRWAASVEAVAARFPEASVVVPSHGAPGGRALLDRTIELARRGRSARGTTTEEEDG